MTAPRQPSPQEQAKLQAIKRTWDQRRHINEHLKRIRYKVAVYSGKGGVGKTTIAINLAVTLARQGRTVGLMDADIDCPNVVKAMKVDQKARFEAGQFTPAEKWGVKVLSTGFFQEKEDEAIIFRGPMIHNTITQFLEMTEWGDLDYLIVDLPPGTSDAALTIMQTLPLDGFVIVATPQELAKIDAHRSISMVRKMNLAVLGIVENFTGSIFGSGAGSELAKEVDIPFLGSFELRADYRDTSKPAVLLSKAVRQEYEALAAKVRDALEKPAQAAT